MSPNAESPNIDTPATEVYRSVIWFQVKPGKQRAFEAAFFDAGMLTRPKQVDGYLGAELHHSVDNYDEYFVIGEWTSPEAYATWQSLSSETAPAEPLARLLDTMRDSRKGQLTRVVRQP